MAVRYDFGVSMGEALSTGLDAAQDSYDRQVNRRRQKEADALLKEKADREREEYDYSLGQRPFVAHRTGLDIQRAELDNQSAQLGIDQAQENIERSRREAEADKIRRAREAVRTAWPAIEKGDLRGMASAWNNIMPDDPAKSISRKEGEDGVFIVEQEDGDVVEISRDELRQLLADPADDPRTSSSAQTQYLDYVAQHVFGGDKKAAFESLNSSKSRDPREWMARIMAANPYMSEQEAMQRALAIANFDPENPPSFGGGDDGGDMGGAGEDADPEQRFGLWDGIKGVASIVGGALLNPRGTFGVDPAENSAAAPEEAGELPPDGSLPPEAVSMLREGKNTRFKNGQVWTLQNGQPVRVQ